MSQGDKTKYTDKQKRRAKHIEAEYEARGVAPKEATARAWATVNSIDGGGNASGSGRSKAPDPSPAKRGGKASGTKAGSRKKQTKA